MHTVCIYPLLVSDRGFDLALPRAWRRDSLQCIATISPHLGNTLSGLLWAHRNWLIVPCTFPDVGFNFRDLWSTCLTRAKAKYENKTMVIFKKWTEGPFFKTITQCTRTPLFFLCLCNSFVTFGDSEAHFTAVLTVYKWLCVPSCKGSNTVQRQSPGVGLGVKTAIE